MAGSFPHKIIIYGDGLAGQLAATALLKALPKETDIILLGTQADAKTDIFYGSVTSPSIYDFFLSLGISEPEVLLNTSTSFSLGTQYEAWGADNRSWTQSFHTPLPLFGTVGFHHYLKRLSNAASKPFALSDYIMSVQAAEKGVFAHPPEGQKIPLATVKYGYHFHPFEWVEFLSQRLKPSRIKEKKGSVKELNIENGRIISLTLADGQQIDSDLVIDCGGQDSIISQALSETNAHHWQGQRRLKASVKVEPSDAMESV
jgi:tryptophan halogenase